MNIYPYNKVSYEDDDEYLAFAIPEDVDDDSAGKVGYVSFKMQIAEESKKFPFELFLMSN